MIIDMIVCSRELRVYKSTLYKSFHQVILLADNHPLHAAEDYPVLFILRVQIYLFLQVIH